MAELPKKTRGSTKQKKPNEMWDNREQNEKIIAAINRVADEQHAANYEDTPKDKSKRCREVATIISILSAAVVALIAIYVSDRDSSDQIGTVRRQLDIMEADQRPWLRASVTKKSNIVITDKTFTFPIRLQWANSGKSPAFAVRGYAWLHKGDGSLLDEHDAHCRVEESAAIANKNPKVIFPGEANEPAFQGVTLMLKGDVSSLQINPKDGPPYLSPEILGCIVYKSGTNPRWRHTWFDWHIFKYDQKRNLEPITADAQVIQSDDIFLDTFLTAGRNQAD